MLLIHLLRLYLQEEKKVNVRLEKINRAIFFYMEVRELNSEQRRKLNTDYGYKIFDQSYQVLQIPY